MSPRYASEHMSEPADYLGTKMMEDCIEYMATEESQEGLKRKRNHPSLLSSKASKATKAEAEKPLLDIDRRKVATTVRKTATAVRKMKCRWID